MAGSALTNSFMIGTATVMIGAEADLFTLTPAANSIGLVKNFTMAAAPAYVELTQGVTNTIVASTLTSNKVNATMEVFEYTSKNLSYALGLDASAVVSTSTVTTTTTAGATGTQMTPEMTIAVTSATGLTAGEWIRIQNGTDDEVYIDQIVSVASLVLTLTFGIPATFAAGASVTKVNRIDIGSLTAQPYLSAKVAGVISGNIPVTLLVPKLRITKGFNVQFLTDNYHNLPFEFTVYDLVATDTFYSTFHGHGSCMVLTDQ